MEQMRERVARVLCELHIRNVRRHDTSLPELEAMLPGAVDYAWQDFLPEADAALSLMQPEIDRRVAEEKARLLEAESSIIGFQLLWEVAPRPPAHLKPMKGCQTFATFDQAVDFMSKLAPDSKFVSLTKIEKYRTDLTAEALAQYEKDEDK